LPEIRGVTLVSGRLGSFYVVMGLAYQLLYHGLQSPLRLEFWFHVLGWPVFVVLGLLRFVFMPFAVVALVGFLAIALFESRRR
jgi:lysylphosphatidylglycerol synthetase-like protein (DUF2156 family)